ncbi:hypothetical protein LJC60_06320 [Ruminococcaceae bacterium OttesenSCG-928-D13]|nr:hypothetical protein [Ruminococcaceae bacterium OttesenSCG-928-D13]
MASIIAYSDISDTVIEAQFMSDTTAVLSLASVDLTTPAGTVRYVADKLRDKWPGIMISFCSLIQRKPDIYRAEAQGKAKRDAIEKVSSNVNCWSPCRK